MAFDFPASPTTGQVYTQNGAAWQWDGARWIGGAPMMSRDQDEQFFDLSGKTQQDVMVPTWAKGVEIIASIVLPTNSALVARVSADGTTFPSGASDYANANPYHVSLPSSLFSSTPQGNSPYLVLGLGGNSGAIPQQVDAFLTLERRLTSEGFTARAYARSLDSTSGSTTNWNLSWVAGTTLGSSLRIAALRFFVASGAAMGNGSFLKLKWIGDLAQVPTGNAISDAPSDGGEYVRVNGVWRLKSQTFVIDGLTQLDVDVPATAKILRLNGSIWWAAIAANNSVTWRASVDGTNFLSGAADYFYGGLIHYTGTPTSIHLPPTNEAYGRLTFPYDTPTQPARIRWLFQVVKSTNTSALHAGTVNAGYYNTPAGNAYTDAQFTTGVQSGANLSIKKLRFFNGPVGGAFGNGSSIICEWMY